MQCEAGNTRDAIVLFKVSGLVIFKECCAVFTYNAEGVVFSHCAQGMVFTLHFKG